MGHHRAICRPLTLLSEEVYRLHWQQSPDVCSDHCQIKCYGSALGCWFGRVWFYHQISTWKRERGCGLSLSSSAGNLRVDENVYREYGTLQCCCSDGWISRSFCWCCSGVSGGWFVIVWVGEGRCDPDISRWVTYRARSWSCHWSRLEICQRWKETCASWLEWIVRLVQSAVAFI